MYLAGIDLGTTGCKCMVFDAGGAILGSCYIEYGLIFTKEGVEQDANLWWNYSVQALKGALSSAGVSGKALRALAVSSQGISSVAVDSSGRPLANAVSWYDQRAEKEGSEIAAAFGADWLFETTGRHPSSVFFPQILHLKKNRRELYDKAAFFFMPQDYMVYRLCGEAVTDYTMASGTLCFDTSQCRWIDEIFQRFEIAVNKFPVLKPFGEIAGKILPAAAVELGLSENTLVAVGMQDQKAAALGAGIEKGIITLSLGTAGALSRLSETPLKDSRKRVYCHAFDGKSSILENHIGAAGASLKWLRDTVFPGKSYAELDEMAAGVEPCAGGLYFTPDLGTAQGVWSGLSLKTGAAEMVRSVLEGVAFSVRECLDAQRDTFAEAEKTVLRVFGGGAKSRVWLQILADCFSLPVSLPRTNEAANLGAAVCAGMAAGLIKTPEDRRKFIGEALAGCVPDGEKKNLYDSGYRSFVTEKMKRGSP